MEKEARSKPAQDQSALVSQHPTADGRRHVMHLTPKRKYAPEESAHDDEYHTDRLDNFTVMEVTLKSRCHGHQLEGLSYPITPIGMHYVLIHYDIPHIEEASYELRICGLVKNPLKLSMANIRARPKIKMAVTMECGGSGGLSHKQRPWPQVPLNRDAVSTYEWAGTPLRAVLEEAGVLPEGMDVVFTGRDKGIQGGEVQYFQHAVQVALLSEAFLAYEMNGQPLTPQHGFPLRLIVPGWFGMTNVKWLDSIEVIATKFSGSQMKWYSLAKNEEDPTRVPLTEMKVRALMIPPGVPDFFTRSRYLEECASVELRGRAWAGQRAIKSVEVSIDHGATWALATLECTIGRFAWVGWTFTWQNVTVGEYTLSVRATDENGTVQTGKEESAPDYYAMSVSKPQYVDVVVVAKGTLKPGNKIDVPIKFPTL